jgi:hypothetical protein
MIDLGDLLCADPEARWASWQGYEGNAGHRHDTQSDRSKGATAQEVRNNRVVSFHNPDEAVQDQVDSCRKDQPRKAENFQQYRHSSFSPLPLGTVLITGPVAVSSQRHEEHRQIRL